MSITHTGQITGTDNPAYQVSKNVWNAAHTIDDASVGIAKIDATGTPSASNHLRGDGVWNSIAAPYKYLIRKESGNYCLYDSDHALLTSNASFDVIVNDEAFAGLTGSRTMPETIVIQGDGHVSAWEIDDTIKLPNLVDLVLNNVKLTAPTNFNKNMLENANPATHNYGVFIRGLGVAMIDGNGPNQTAGANVLNFTNATEMTPVVFYNIWLPSALMLENLFITDDYGNNDTVKIDFSGSTLSQFMFKNCNISSGHIAAGKYACYLVSTYDSIITNTGLSGETRTFRSEGGSGSRYDFSYFNGCGLLYGCRGVNVTGNYWDNSYDAHSLELLYSRHCSVHDINFNRLGSDAYTGKAGIFVNDTGSPYYSVNNRFSNLYFGRHGFTGTNVFDYGIEESAADNDYNLYTGINGVDCGTAAIRKLGANSVADAAANIGTIATS